MKPTSILGNIPQSLRNELISVFNDIVRNYREKRWEPSELNGGKLCEVIYSIIEGYVRGSFPVKSSKPQNMIMACRSLEQAPTTFPNSIRLQIPRILIAVYDIRNHRGVGHVGGEVDPNHMDAVMVLYSAKWLMAELVRVFHDVDPETATLAVEALVERELPLIWDVNGKKRVLDTKLSMKEKTLVILYSEIDGISEENLLSWIEHSNPAVFRRDILRPSHRAKLLEYDEKTKTITISPKGNIIVENILNRNFN